MTTNSGYNHNFPIWAKCRPEEWMFIGWIVRDANYRKCLAEAQTSDHGEIRGQDFYGEGAVCWMKEVK